MHPGGDGSGGGHTHGHSGGNHPEGSHGEVHREDRGDERSFERERGYTPPLLYPFPYFWGYGYGYPDYGRDLEIRRKNIEDSFGVKPVSLKKYIKQDNYSALVIGSAVGVACGGVVGGVALFLLGAPLFLLALGIGLATALITGGITWSLRNSKNIKDYNAYLDDVAAKARMERDKGKAISQECNKETPGKSQVAMINTQRQQEGLETCAGKDR